MVSLVGEEAPAPSGSTTAPSNSTTAPSSSTTDTTTPSTTDTTTPSTTDTTTNDQQIQKLQQLVNRQFAIEDYKGAVRACEELCALISAKYDELHDECAGPYYQYATALLEIAREENQILGDSKLNPEADEDEDEKEDEEAADSSAAQPGASSSAAAAEEVGEEEEEDVSSLQIAWEVLELSRVIYSRQTTPESQKHLANVKLKLGEICMEDEKLEEALVQFGEAIQSFIRAGEERDSRTISSTYYMMGLAASLDQKYEAAVDHFAKCSELISSQIAQTEGPEKDSLTEMQLEVDKMIADCKDSLKQLEQYRTLIPQAPAAAAGPAAAATASAAASARGSCCDSSTASPTLLPASSTLPPASSTLLPASSTLPAASSTLPPASSMLPPASSTLPPASSTLLPASSTEPSSTSSSGFAPSSSAPVSNISHLVRKRPVSQPIQPISQSQPSSTSEITAKIIKPTVRVSPIVSSSTSPVQTNRETNSETNRETNSETNRGSDGSEDISSTNGARSGGIGSSTTPPTTGQTNGVSSSTSSRLAGSTSGFATPTSGFATPTSVRQVATVSSVQRAEEAISSSSDFKRPAEDDSSDMTSNEAKRSKQ